LGRRWRRRGSIFFFNWCLLIQFSHRLNHSYRFVCARVFCCVNWAQIFRQSLDCVAFFSVNRSGHDPKKNNPRIIFWPQKWFIIRDPRSESFSQPWSVIRNSNYFFSYDPQSVIQIIFSIIRSASVQIISLVMMIILQIVDHFYGLRITDYFCKSRIIFRIVDCMMKQKNNPQNDPTIKCIWSDLFYTIRNRWFESKFESRSAIRIILGSMICAVIRYPDHFFDDPAHSWCK